MIHTDCFESRKQCVLNISVRVSFKNSINIWWVEHPDFGCVINSPSNTFCGKIYTPPVHWSIVLYKYVFTWVRSNCCVLAYWMANFPIICAVETIVRIFWLAKWQSNCRIKKFICQLILNIETCSIFTKITDSLFELKERLNRFWWRILETKCVGDNFVILVTDFRCWWPIYYIKKVTDITQKVLSPISENCYHHKVNNIPT